MDDPIERGYVTAPSGLVHYRAAGRGPVLLLLHQTATSGRSWEPLLRRLAHRFRLIALDTPGFGLSDPPPTPYQMPEYAAAVAAALAALGVTRCHVLGHHTGAAIALQLAVDFPALVDRLVLHACPTGSEAFRQAKLAEAVPVSLQEDGSHIDWVRQRLLSYTTPLPPDELHALIVEYLIALPRAFEAHRAVWTQRAELLAPRVRAPTLLLTGEADLFAADQDAFAQRFPSARSRIVPGGRFLQLEDPDRYAALIASFLEEPLRAG
jgi:pimeloyl-ACP methyl ester carboxylesterase